MTCEDVEPEDLETCCRVCGKQLSLEFFISELLATMFLDEEQMANEKETRCPECLFPVLLKADGETIKVIPLPTLMPMRS